MYIGQMSDGYMFVVTASEIMSWLFVGKMSTGDDYGHRQGRNGEFCVGPVTWTADILTQSVIWQTWAVC